MTPFTIAQIDELTAMITGEKIGRAATRDKALTRFMKACNVIELNCNNVLEMPIQRAKEVIQAACERFDAEAVAANEARAAKKAPQSAKEPAPASPPADPPADRPADRLEAAGGPFLRLTNEEWDKGGKRVEPGRWEKERQGAHIVITRDSKTGEWGCVVTRGEIRGESSGRGFMTVCRAAEKAFNAMIEQRAFE